MGWLIALGILVLLAIMPLGASVIYNSDGPLIRIIAGPLKLQVFPVKKKDKTQKKRKKTKKSPKDKPKDLPPADKQAKSGKDAGAENQKQDPKAEAPKQGGPITDFLPLVKVGLDFLGDLRRKLRINCLELNLILAGGDPCDLATNYGKYWAALGNLWPRLEELFVIKKRNVQLQCDFEGSQTLVTARLDLTITLGRILSLAVRYGIRAIKELLKINNKRKGGAAL